MDAAPTLHPTDQALHFYGLGKLDDAAAEEVNRHLESCVECRQRVAGLSSDSFLGRVREAHQQDGRTSSYIRLTGKSAAYPPAAETMPPGLADHPDYEVLQELGRGGMGVVYLAHNKLMGRDEVLKVMGSAIVNRPGVLDRFLREIRAVARLHHPNIVTAYSAVRLGESIVFAMQYVEGMDLSKLVKLKGPLPVAHACAFIQQAALGLQHAHEAGLVHRDIKPGNLMLSRVGGKSVVKVLDFGLAKATREGGIDSALTHEGQALGTPDYIAPEQILDAQKADIRADIYSLGGTLFYLLTGRPPFLAKSLYDLYQAHISRDTDPLNLIRPEVPAELAALVSKMMAKDVSRRFQEPSEVAEALAPFFKKAAAVVPAPPHSPKVKPVPQRLGNAPPPPMASTPTGPAIPVAKPTPPAAAQALPANPIDRVGNAATTKPSQGRPPWLWPAVGVGALLLGVLLWQVIVRVKTPDGVVVIEDLPKDAVVTVDGAVATLEWPDGKGIARVSVPTGDRKVKVEIHGVEVFGEVVTIAVGDERRIHVRAEPARPATVPFDASQFEVFDGGWVVRGDELIQSDERAQFPGILFGDPGWTDYDFTAEFQRLAGLSDISLIARANGLDDHLRFAVSAKGGWKYSLIEAVEPDGPGRWLQSAVYPIASLKWYKARVQVRGDLTSAMLYDDGKVVVDIECRDVKHPRGRVGFRTWAASYKIRNIQVAAPDGTILWAGPPSIGSRKGPTATAAPTQTDPGRDASTSAGLEARNHAGRRWESPTTGMLLTRIEPGTFVMGSTIGNDDEKPAHPVTITKPYLLGIHEVTQGQYQEVMNKNPSLFRATARQPVEQVSWFDAIDFCNALSVKDGLPEYYQHTGDQVTALGGIGYRLPTEAEWEYACRAGSGNADAYCFGKDVEMLKDYAWYGNNAQRTTHAVGEKRPNAWGLYDMHGNLWEWCEDVYDADFYRQRIEKDPLNSKQLPARALRGGCWMDNAWNSRSTSRYSNKPTVHYPGRGIRVARNFPEPIDPASNIEATGGPDDQPGSTPNASGAGPRRWIPLFNGKDTAGWHAGPANGGTWKVVDGILEIRGGDQDGAIARYVTDRSDYQDFRMRARLINEGSHNGLFVRHSGDTSKTNGYFIQTRVGSRNDGSIIPIGSISKATEMPLGRATNLHALANSISIPEGDWYDLEVTAIGNKITTYVNGRKAAEFTDDQNPYLSGNIKVGCIERDTIRFKEISIGEVPPQ